MPCPTARFNPLKRIFLEALRTKSFSSEYIITKWLPGVLNPAAEDGDKQVSSAAESWDSSAFTIGRRKPEKKPEHTGTGISPHRCSREARIAEEVSILTLGEEANAASPVGHRARCTGSQVKS